MTSGIPHGLKVINKSLEEKGGREKETEREREGDLQAAVSVSLCCSVAECFIVQCVPIFSFCQDYCNQAVTENITSQAYKERTDILN